MLEERVRIARLLDIYGGLLTDRQQRILSHYVLEDFSLGEIAEEEGISRQAVHDTVRRGTQSMEEYEKVLKLFQNEQQQKKELQDILKDVTSESKKELDRGIRRLQILVEK